MTERPNALQEDDHNNLQMQILLWTIGVLLLQRLSDDKNDVHIESMLDFWMIAGKAINNMYKQTISSRAGIG